MENIYNELNYERVVQKLECNELDYEDLLDLKKSADEKHEEAILVLNNLGIQQDGDSYLITNVPETLRILQKRKEKQKEKGIRSRPESQNVDLRRTGRRQLLEMDRSHEQLDVGLQLNNSNNKTSTKKKGILVKLKKKIEKIMGGRNKKKGGNN